eukprot:Nitzschia sp. Nitz4//scaffold2_size372955//284221//286248//NITZ4_000455-RA/size372955-processed-gene-0.532-mRNA-1//-1//CDS//3329546874//6042//frame0
MSCIADLDWVCGEETMDASGARKGTMASFFSGLVTPRNAPEPTDSFAICENNSILEESRSPDVSEPMEDILHAQHQGVVNGPCNTPQAILVSTDRFDFDGAPKKSSKSTPKKKQVVLPAPPTPTHKDAAKVDPPPSSDACRDAVPADESTTPNEESNDTTRDEHAEIVESPSASSDHRTRTLERVKELRQLRSRNLAKRNAEKLQQCAVPENAASFLEKQRELSQEQRQKEKDAKDSLHSYRSSDRELLEGFRKTMSKDSTASRQEIQMSYSSPAYYGMNEVDEFYLYQKEVSEWRGQRARSFEENAIASSMDDETVVVFERSTTGHVRETAASMEEKWSWEETTKASATFASNADSEVSEPEGPYEVLQDIPTDEYPSEPEPVVDDDTSDMESSHDSTPEPAEPKESPETVERESMEDAPPAEQEEEATELTETVPEEPVVEDNKVSEPTLDVEPTVANEPAPQSSGSATPRSANVHPSSPHKEHKSLLSTPNVQKRSGTSPSFDMADTDKSRSNRSALTLGSVPSCGPSLKQVPLYSRRPLQASQDRPNATAAAAPVLVCSSRYIPNLHSSRDGCERCLYWASEEEKAKFAAEGHHLRIMRVRGGCDRNCTIFPRKDDEYPVRLCKKCFFDTHRKPDLTMEEGFKN